MSKPKPFSVNLLHNVNDRKAIIALSHKQLEQLGLPTDPLLKPLCLSKTGRN
jgi:hypothetical protein